MGGWVFTNYFCETLDVDTFRLVFSTLAQVFGAILGLYLVAVLYIADKIRDDKVSLMEQDHELLKIFWNYKIKKRF